MIMPTLTPVQVTLPESKEPTAKNVQDIIATFLTREWPYVDIKALTVTYYKATCTNLHVAVERPPPTSIAATEPLKVFIKFHDSNTEDVKIFKHLLPTEYEEMILCHEYSRFGLGVKVYGFFETQDGTIGRVDEFLDARNMEPEDVENSEIRADIARGLAAFHTMETSLPRNPVVSFYNALMGGLEKYRGMDKLKALGKEGGVNVDNLIHYDLVGKLKRVVEKLKSLSAKEAWCIHDVQYMNVLVKKNPEEGESKITLIDFELVMRNYRAFDIGGHFMQKMFKWFGVENKVADCRKYTEKEKEHFCEEYAQEWNKRTGDSDTGNQIFRESEYGYMLAIAFDLHNMLCFMANEDDKDTLNLLALNKLFHEFLGQYSRLGLENIP
ncbi:hypothetical protein TWF694_004641 [Orbilia ellipsospora]|uniref:Choline/ethanolamine kinase n=1 Tax=Orbilia ellipsospora TaxID=2528407 RepID=A0AAV9WVP9_9PEZI